jgi:NadR type nicotinamide-nucleotide adenylyltransferase
LHRGHQLVIETALAETERVSVIIYDCPETTDIPLPVRARWMSRLYPTVDIIQAWDGPAEVGSDQRIQQLHEEYVLRTLGVSGITHFYSSEFYGEHMSRALRAVNRLVDPARETVPISGTDIRREPFRYREYLDPLVYRDLVTNVVFVGAPSTGKSALAARLARLYDTQWMPEHGREYWMRHQVGRRLTPEQLVELAEQHLEREEALLGQARGYLFTDTNAITTYMFALRYHGGALPQLAELAREAASRYDVVFLCDSDIPYAETWDRSGEADRAAFQREIIADLRRRNLPYVLLSGDLDVRVARVRSVLDAFRKYAR